MKPLFTIRAGSPANWVLRVVGVVLLVLALIYIPTRGSNSLIEQTTNAFTLMGAAMALNLLLGFAGQISLGHSAFFGVGAYSTGILISRYTWSPWLTFFVAFAAAFVLGMIVSLPALRIKGTYLALVTLSLALVFPNVIKWQKLAWFTGGARGLDKTGFNFREMRTFKVFGKDFFGDLRALEGKTAFLYWIAAIVVIITYLVCRGVVKSRVGRSLIAIRDNETAAAVMGVNLMVTKGFVFGISAGLTALVGSLSALRTGNVTTDSPNLTLIGSITFLIVMVIGGAGSLTGPIVGAALFVFITARTGEWAEDDKIPGVIRPFFAWAKITPATGIFATLLILLMFIAPRGVVGLWRQHLPRLVRIVPKPAGSGASSYDRIAADVLVTDVEDDAVVAGEVAREVTEPL